MSAVVAKVLCPIHIWICFIDIPFASGVAQVVESDFLELHLFKHPAKMFCYIIRAHELPCLVETDVVEVIPAVRAFEYPLV